MKKTIHVKVIPRAKKSLIEPFGDGLKIHTTAPAYDGKANSALIEILADYLKVKKARITIIKGSKSRSKLIEIC